MFKTKYSALVLVALAAVIAITVDQVRRSVMGVQADAENTAQADSPEKAEPRDALVAAHNDAGTAAEEACSFRLQKQAARKASTLPDTTRRAKNVILFLGDGMGVSTVTAARVLDGQRKGGLGEDNQLFFDGFEFTALSKTYAVNQQTSDSGSTMTAIMTGHKTKAYVINYDANVVLADQSSTVESGGKSRPLETLMETFEKEGKATGIVTTTRLTDATPAACYAHAASREWEYQDEEPSARFKKALEAGFKDIARQLVEFPHGDGLDVALGGGRRAFLPVSEEEEPEHPEKWGERGDGRNLVQDWLKKPGTGYVTTRQELLQLDTAKPVRLLGLFTSSHLRSEVDVDPKKERTQPHLSEMATTALGVLRHNTNGFFLMVEGGMIDKAHHVANAHTALVETIEFDRAIQAVYESLSPREREETLIIVTADHSHTLTISGYPTRGNPILGKVYGNDRDGNPEKEPELDELGLPYTTLSYANGPGSTALLVHTKKFTTERGGLTTDKFLPVLLGRKKYIRAPVEPRPDLTKVDTEARKFVQEGLVPMKLETHGGEDVAIYAKGPGSHLFRGTREQNYIFHAIQQALGRP